VGGLGRGGDSAFAGCDIDGGRRRRAALLGCVQKRMTVVLFCTHPEERAPIAARPSI